MATLGTGAFYTKSTTQKINTTSSCEAELVALAKGLQQSLWTVVIPERIPCSLLLDFSFLSLFESARFSFAEAKSFSIPVLSAAMIVRSNEAVAGSSYFPSRNIPEIGSNSLWQY